MTVTGFFVLGLFAVVVVVLTLGDYDDTSHDVELALACVLWPIELSGAMSVPSADGAALVTAGAVVPVVSRQLGCRPIGSSSVSCVPEPNSFARIIYASVLAPDLFDKIIRDRMGRHAERQSICCGVVNLRNTCAR
ncbi:hypothetical protein JK2ML_1979 [Mycobacterium leprae Kyoto-2]|uniref:Uncharacterized protein n=3 Tax=Mycobacterium leprae TaxID=1769 RepID=Q9CBH3_MYCLE|nr:hypothetical protein [Mycobacterium leprae]CAR72076.1 hypothetical protein MLBr01979 [Mycobacterium leprae Br4923]AWV48381.1 hypothetical protein DIJ64_10845 [Mycobacterium leprae]OAR20821.1 hypothetical protein A8144_02145 [Mycobacterium leprae 3125609]OAX72025.1 hypothetical protein A3216_02230 [Mycobacterium leprae 7935681]CAC30934.1 hypothetical protein [Mycobacterium leprae]